MAKGRRQTGGLAALERQLSALDARRHRLLRAIKAVVEQLAYGSAAPMAGLNLQARRGRGSAGRQRVVSAEVRERLSRLAKERWAKAKKAGKTRL